MYVLVEILLIYIIKNKNYSTTIFNQISVQKLFIKLENSVININKIIIMFTNPLRVILELKNNDYDA